MKIIDLILGLIMFLTAFGTIGVMFWLYLTMVN